MTAASQELSVTMVPMCRGSEGAPTLHRRMGRETKGRDRERKGGCCGHQVFRSPALSFITCQHPHAHTGIYFYVFVSAVYVDGH